ncbi:MAG: hypothetical protein Kow00121_47060 [Elainellaceae cyanobacterium]
MALVHLQSMLVLETLLEQMQSALSGLSNGCRESIVWVGSNNAAWIPEIEIHETDMEVVLHVQMPELQLQNLEIQISPETAVIQGNTTQDAVEGFFSSERFQHLIPLPFAVHPEAVQATFSASVLKLALPKSGRTQRQRIVMQLTEPDRAATSSELPCVEAW